MEDTIQIMYNGYKRLMKSKGYASYAEEPEFRAIIEYLAAFEPLLRGNNGDKTEDS